MGENGWGWEHIGSWRLFGGAQDHGWKPGAVGGWRDKVGLEREREERMIPGGCCCGTLAAMGGGSRERRGSGSLQKNTNLLSQWLHVKRF